MENNLNIFILDMKNSIDCGENLILHDDEMAGLVKVLEGHFGQARDTSREALRCLGVSRKIAVIKSSKNKSKEWIDNGEICPSCNNEMHVSNLDVINGVAIARKYECTCCNLKFSIDGIDDNLIYC